MIKHERNPKRRPEYWRPISKDDFEDNPTGLTPQMIGTVFGRTFLLTEEHPDGSGRHVHLEGKNGDFALLDVELPENTASAIEEIESFAETVYNWQGMTFTWAGPDRWLNLTTWNVGIDVIFSVKMFIEKVEADGYRIGFEVTDRDLGGFDVDIEKIFRSEQIAGARARMLTLLEVEAFRIAFHSRHVGTKLTVKELSESLAKDGISEKDIDVQMKFNEQMKKQKPERN